MNKTILVINVAASSGGALTILKQYYDKALKDIDNNWIFILSTPKLADTQNIKIINYPWIKKSWIHRIYFDKFKVRKIIKKLKPDKIINLQNIAIKTKIKQELYLHQPLPFTPIKFSLFKNPKLWTYQNVISRKIIKSLKFADNIIVQTNWMKEAVIRINSNLEKKIEIIQPKVNKDNILSYKKRNNIKTFFYPASAIIYKNHEVIFKASQILAEKGYENFEILFTLKGNETKKIRRIYKKSSKFNIKFIGIIPYKKVFELYSESILLFPSYVETFGLPLLEARLSNSPIIASDMPYSREICDSYEKVSYFKYDDYKKLSQLMERHL